MASSSTSSGPSRHHLLTAEEKTACISLRSAGWKLPKIVAHLGLNYDTIYKFCKCYDTTGSKESAYSTAGNPKYSPQAIRNMIRNTQKDAQSRRTPLKEIGQQNDGMSASTVSRHLKKVGIKSYKATRVPLLSPANWMQDNAPIHQSAYSKQGFKLYEIKTMTWPPQSPDLNPIENLWAFLKHRLYKGSPHLYLVQGGAERTKKPIFEALLQAWETIEEDYLGKLLESMPRSMEAVIKAKGGQTRFWFVDSALKQSK